ncbi:MAG: CPBP family intramembrane glutamic endopeptidase [Pirellulales bacterium]
MTCFWSKLLGLLAIYFVLFTAVAIGEESFSRAYQLKNISEGFSFLGPVYSALFAIFVTSAIFALLHWFNPNSNVSTLGILAAGLCWLRPLHRCQLLQLEFTSLGTFFRAQYSGSLLAAINSFFKSLIVINQVGPDAWTGGAFGPEAGLIGMFVIILML